MQEPNLSIYHGETLGNRVFTWWQATRPAFFTASILPICIGLALSWQLTGRLSLDLAVLTLCAMVLIHAGANVLNDYFDAQNGTDGHNHSRIFPFSGGSRFIQNEILSANEMLRFGALLLGLGLVLGLWLWHTTGPLILGIGLLGGLLAIFYSSPPCLACRGLGDLAVVICFGLLPVTGTAWLQLNTVPVSAWWLGAIIGCFTAAILWTNSIPDVVSDRKAGKWTLPARLGQHKARYGLLVWFVIGFALLAVAPLSAGKWAVFVAVLPASKACQHLFAGRLMPAIRLTLLSHLLVGVLLILACLWPY
jgi:1,4-dihydroxy-2-naphthoate octaprenyltransferase